MLNYLFVPDFDTVAIALCYSSG